jgi:hypothetical protein
MKLNDIKQIEENIFSAIKDRFKQGGYQTNVQNIFIKDFVQDAITSLNNGIHGELIDPNIKSNGQPAAAAIGATPVSGTEPAGQQFMGKIAPDARPATKPAAPASPFTAPTLNQPKTTVSATGAPSKPGNITTGGVGMKVKESSYDKMNRIFESIINIDEQAELRTISDYMMDWFGQYMQGVEWEGSRAIVQQKMNKLQDEYPKNIDANLENLARMGLALSKAGSPAGAPPEFTKAKQEMASSVEDLKGTLEELSKSNPRAYNDLIKNLKPVQVGSI